MTRALPTLLLVGMVCNATQAASHPNVLFIAIDDLNDWVGEFAGHSQVKTPHLDRLARRGVAFTNAHCAAPLCGPSRAAVFTGRQPFNTGVYTNQDQVRKLRPDLVLLPEHFASHGYRTLGGGKLMHRRFNDLYDESFFPEQRWSPYPSKRPQSAPTRLAMRPLNGMPNDRERLQPGPFSSFDWGPVEVEDSEMGDGKVADWAAHHLRSPAEQPFFLAAGFYRPHIPLYAPRAYFELYPAQSIVVPETLAGDLGDVSEAAIALAHSIQTAGLHTSILEHRQWQDAVAAYLACVSFVDAQVGRVLDALDEGPHADNTLIVLWSDHGWHLGEKEHWGKTTGWERSTRVPLVIVPAKSDATRIATPGRCDEPVSLIDLFPTLIDLCGLTPKPELDGLSLAPQLGDPEAFTGRAIVTTVDRGIHSVRSRRWRLIRYADGSEELYDHQNDPREWHNLAADARHQTIRDELARAMPAP